MRPLFLLASGLHLQWDGMTRSNLPTLQVGRWPGEQDIVSKGLVTEAWSPKTDAVFEVPSYQFRCRFNAEAAAVDFGAVELQGVQVVSNTTDLSATVQTNGTLPGAMELWIHFTCAAGGAAQVDVTLELAEPFLSPTWSFTKLCRSDPHLGLNVGLSPQAHDIVEGALPTWSPSHVVPYGVFQLDLFLSVDREPTAVLAPPQVVVKEIQSPQEARALVKQMKARQAAGRWTAAASVESSLLDAGLDTTDTTGASASGRGLLRRAGAPRDEHGRLLVALQSLKTTQNDLVTLTGLMAHGGVLENNGTSAALTLGFQCPHPGSFAVEVDFELFPAYQPYHPVPVSFIKVCGGATRAGFHVGDETDPKAFVADGKTVGTPSSVGNMIAESVFAVDYTPLGPRDLDQAPAVTLQCQSILKEHIVDLSVEATHDKLTVGYACAQPGLALCEMSFGFTMWQAPSTVQWSKECFGARHDVNVMSELESMPVAIQDGQLSPDWNVTMPWEDDVLRLFVNSSEDLMVAGVTVREAGDWSHFQEEIQHWEATASGQAASTFVVGPTPTVVELRVNCTADGTRNVMLTLDLGLFDSIQVPFRKTCRLPRWYEDPVTLGLMVLAAVVVIAVPVSLVAMWASSSLTPAP